MVWDGQSHTWFSSVVYGALYGLSLLDKLVNFLVSYGCQQGCFEGMIGNNWGWCVSPNFAWELTARSPFNYHRQNKIQVLKLVIINDGIKMMGIIWCYCDNMREQLWLIHLVVCTYHNDSRISGGQDFCDENNGFRGAKTED